MISATVGEFSDISRAIEVTPRSVNPQGFMAENHDRSVVTLRARPCMVMNREHFMPIAHILRSLGVPLPIHTPVAPSMRSPYMP